MTILNEILKRLDEGWRLQIGAQVFNDYSDWYDGSIWFYPGAFKYARSDVSGSIENPKVGSNTAYWIEDSPLERRVTVLEKKLEILTRKVED